MEERIGEAFEFGERLTVVGRKLKVGDVGPEFALDYFDPASSAMSTVRLSDSAGQMRLLHVVNSLDTPVCHVGTHRWHDLGATLPPGVVIYTISMDLPFAQARWRVAEGVTHQSLSSHRSEQFGEDYGVLLKEWRLLQRAVFVIGHNDEILYAEYVADQMQEPNYHAAFEVLHQATT
ncbi:thiol peroxidase [Abditibacteriota bacterium]|nr:thiol peroxidase [Abditibacteriota bacterium]